MLVVTGIFDDEKFIPDNPVVIPQKKKVVVTIEEEKDDVRRSLFGVLPSNIDLDKEHEEKLAALNRITGVISGNSMTLKEARMNRLSRQ